MSASLEQLTVEFTQLIGPEAFAPREIPMEPPANPPVAEGDTAAAAPEPAAPDPPPPSPVQNVDFLKKGYNFDATVASTLVVEAAQILDRAGYAIDAITGVDWIAEEQMEIVYDFFHPVEPLRVVVRTRVPRANPELPTISEVFPGANWHERETHDFFGIRFLGHPNPTPILLPEDADFHPLRKDYLP